MAALPAHTRKYHSRNNIPVGSNNTTQLIMESFYTWGLYACLTDQVTTGSTASAEIGSAPDFPGTRDASSVWIVRGASNGTTVSQTSAAGVANSTASALWGNGTFPGAFTRGTSSTPHHWMLLENVALGYEMIINFTQNTGYLCVSIAPTGTWPASGGTTSVWPTPSPTTKPVQMNQASYSATDHGQASFFGDTTNFGNTNYLHFTCAPTGEFHYSMSRVGLGTLYNIAGVWRSTGAQAGDNYNTFMLSGNTTTTGRGGWNTSRLNTSDMWASLQPNGGQKSIGGAVMWYIAGTSLIGSTGVDAISAEYSACPIDIIEASPQYVKRGTLPDLYVVGDGPVGSSIPDSNNQIRSVFGNMVVPCVGNALNI